MKVSDLIDDLMKYHEDAIVKVRNADGDFVVADKVITTVDVSSPIMSPDQTVRAGVLIV